MSSRNLKKTVLGLLAGDNIGQIEAELCLLPVHGVIHALFSAICRSDEKVRWNGIRAMGTSVARMADENMEDARVVMRRLLWSLNDESGGIGWGAPEALAEIMACHQGLAEEYIHMLISYMRKDGEEAFQDGNYIEHEVLQRGLLWGMARLAETRPQMLLERNVVADLLPYLRSPDAVVRGLAAKGLGILGADEAVAELRLLENDREAIRLYEDGAVHSATVSDIAVRALNCISSRQTC